MSPSGSVKKRKASEKDYAPSHGTVDIESMTDQQRKDFLAALRREEKRREKAAKGKKLTTEKKAEERAERDYQASLVSSGPLAKKARTSPSAEATSGSEKNADKDSNAGYESGTAAAHNFAIDPALDVPPRKSSDPKKKTKIKNVAATPSIPTKVSKGAANINVADPKALSTTLQPSRQMKQVLKQKGGMSDSDSADNDSSSSDSSDDDDSAKPGAAIGPYTPYKRARVAGGKHAPALTALSPTSKSIAEDMRSAYTVLLVSEDAFPEEKAGKKQARRLFLAEVDAYAHGGIDSDDEEADRRVRRGERYKGDPQYKADMVQVTMGVESSFRGHIVSDAEPLVEAEWRLGDLGVDECRTKVQTLLKKGTFTFADSETRKGAFGCPVVWRLLRKSFLTKEVKKGHPLGLGPNLQVFSEVPPALLAFLLTAIECVLRRYSTGKYDNAHHFTMARYEPIYTQHLKALHQAERGNSAGLYAIRKQIWDQACKSAGISEGLEVGSIDDEDGYMSSADIAALGPA